MRVRRSRNESPLFTVRRQTAANVRKRERWVLLGLKLLHRRKGLGWRWGRSRERHSQNVINRCRCRSGSSISREEIRYWLIHLLRRLLLLPLLLFLVLWGRERVWDTVCSHKIRYVRKRCNANRRRTLNSGPLFFLLLRLTKDIVTEFIILVGSR